MAMTLAAVLLLLSGSRSTAAATPRLTATGASSCIVTASAGGGAHGRGRHGTRADDGAALQRALDDPACDEVVLPPGSVFAASQLFVRRR